MDRFEGRGRSFLFLLLLLLLSFSGNHRIVGGAPAGRRIEGSTGLNWRSIIPTISKWKGRSDIFVKWGLYIIGRIDWILLRMKSNFYKIETKFK